MRQFTMKLDKKHQRPVVVLKNGLTALLDTGAYIPVWTDDEDILISFLGAEFVRSNVQMSGFGGVTYGNLYKVNIDAGGILYPRACLKIHSCQLHAPLCGIFGPHSVNVARYASLIRVKSPTNCDAHLTESIFQTRSRYSRYNRNQKRI